MVNFKRFLFQSSLSFTAFFLLGTGSAFAASIYGVTETTATVGTNAPLEIEYTVDTAVQTWADGDTLTLTLPDNFPQWSALTFTVENDGDVTNDATNETAITVGGGNGQYAIASRTITVKWDATTWGVVNDDAETIRFLITAANVPTYANASSTFTFGGTTAGADTNPTGTDTVNVSADALTATNIEPYVFVKSSWTTHVVSLTTTIEIPSGGKISLTFPSGFDVSQLSTTTAQRLSGMSGTWTATVVGQVVTFTQSGGSATSAGVLSFEVVPVRNPTTTGMTGTYTITTKDSSGNNLETDAAVSGDSIGVTSSSTDPVVGTPTGLTVTDAEDGNGVTITWTDPDDDTVAIEILRGVSPLPVDGEPIMEIPLGLETYTDTDLELGDIVTYQLRAINGTTTGTLTDEVTLTVGSGTTSDSDDTSDEEDTSDDSTDDTAEEDEDMEEMVVEFSDISSSHWASMAIGVMAEAGVVEGYEDGTFLPNENLNRAEAAALLWRIVWVGEPYEVTADPFEDVEMSAWYAGYVNDLMFASLVEGNPDGTYEPSEEINRAEFLQLSMNVYLYLYPDMEASSDELMDGDATDMFADLDTAAWYEGVVTVAAEWDFVNGSACDEGTCFNASSSITRAEATQILYNMFGDDL